MRRRVIAVRVGVLAGLVALIALMVPAVLRSDWANTAVQISPAPRQVGLFSLPEQPRQLWQAASIPPGGAAAQPNPAVQVDTVVTASTHRIEGRDPHTGTVRWFYERRNATLCSWTTQDGQVFAAFRKAHGCRDLVALNAGTGLRTWNRNSELNADIRLLAMPSVLLAVNSRAIVAFDTGGSLDRWKYSKPGCTIGAPVPGDQGIAVLAYCGGGPAQLILLDTFSGHERFKPVTVGDAPAILSTSQVVCVLSGGADTPILTLYGVNGAVQHSLYAQELRYDDPARTGGTIFGNLLIGWTGRAVFAVPISTGKLQWSAPATGPAATGTDDVAFPTATGYGDVSVDDGKPKLAFSADHPGELAGLDRLGAQLLASGAQDITAYG